MNKSQSNYHPREEEFPSPCWAPQGLRSHLATVWEWVSESIAPRPSITSNCLGWGLSGRTWSSYSNLIAALMLDTRNDIIRSELLRLQKFQLSLLLALEPSSTSSFVQRHLEPEWINGPQPEHTEKVKLWPTACSNLPSIPNPVEIYNNQPRKSVSYQANLQEVRCCL